ncbi:MAG: hypothetical protein M3014_08975, partial [Chloroflexota bacterium]|nr:hypothetical protein [Chloroflexota bacterium]
SLLAFIGCALLLPRLLLFGRFALSLVTSPWQFDYDEGINLNVSLLLAAGKNIYPHNGPDAFLSAPYSPLFHLLVAPFTWVTGPSFAAGRALSLACTICIAILLAYVVWRATKVWALGVVSGALWLSLSPVIVWSSFYKQDMLALFLGLAGLSWALTFTQGRRLYVAALLFALAFYAKQTGLSAATATALWLLLRAPKSGIRFSAALCLMLVLPFALGNILLRGGPWEHMIGNNILPWNGWRFWWSLHRLWGEYWPLVLWSGTSTVVGALLVLSSLLRDRTGGARTSCMKMRERLMHPYTLVVICFLLGWASTLVQIGYEGANFNHLLDALLPTCMLSALSIVWPLRRLNSLFKVENDVPSSILGMIGLAAIALLVALSLGQIYSFRDPGTWFYNAWPNHKSDTQMRAFSDLLARTPGEIYSEDAYLLLSTGHRVLYDDPSTFESLAQLGRWDDARFVQSFRSRRFALVLLSPRSVRWTNGARAAFNANYVLQSSGILEVYGPRRSNDRRCARAAHGGPWKSRLAACALLPEFQFEPTCP